MSCDADEVKYFTVNVMDLSRLKPVELLLVRGKISSREVVQVNKNNLDGTAVLLRSTIKNDYADSFKGDRTHNLKRLANCSGSFREFDPITQRTGRSFTP